MVLLFKQFGFVFVWIVVLFVLCFVFVVLCFMIVASSSCASTVTVFVLLYLYVFMCFSSFVSLRTPFTVFSCVGLMQMAVCLFACRFGWSAC